MTRKIVQITVDQGGNVELPSGRTMCNRPAIIALCDDGTVWVTVTTDNGDYGKWFLIPGIPQDAV